ncbi:MAG: PP2C family protein-serine/threonine phosphatase [Planctomycetota bacterium]|nr:PP2C family protein-serine/threonine phosphatase [Planctomycetota bacterium]
MTATLTGDFRHEFEMERTRWLRVRFQWYCAILSGLTGIDAFLNLLGLVTNWTTWPGGVVFAMNIVQVVIFALPLWWFLTSKREVSRETIVRIVFWMIVLNGLVQLLPATVDFLTRSGDQAPSSTGMGPGAEWMFAVFFSHLIASLFIPWTPTEAVKPLIPLLSVNAVGALLGALFGTDSFLAAIVIVALSPLVGVPGVAIAWGRHGRFRERFHYNALRGRYREMKKELTDARRIHEALFPAPVAAGPVRFDYRYEPMRQIGGDFLYAHEHNHDVAANPKNQAPLSIVIIDVTGHGIPAALTVNRLHGELDRLFAETPDLAPGDVLESLNRYVHLTLANHSVYATAICFRIDPAKDQLLFASGGHPPAFVRTADGRFERLDSTAFVLGACHGADFQPGERTLRFTRGDTLIAYTDGATEARNERGAMLTVDGFQRLLASIEARAIADDGWCGAVLHALEGFRFGPPADDTLVVEVYRPAN